MGSRAESRGGGALSSSLYLSPSLLCNPSKKRMGVKEEGASGVVAFEVGDGKGG